MTASNPIRKALAAAHVAAAVIAGERVTVRRGDRSFAADVVRGSTDWTQEDTDGVIINAWTTVDLIIDAAAYDFGDGPTEPSAADRFDLAGLAGVDIHRLQAPAGETPWRYSPARFPDRLRLFTVLDKKAKA